MSALPSNDSPGFADLGVPPKMAGALSRRAITVPTPIQAVTIPDALDGRDVCGKAPTGSGKTLAFGIPLVLGVGKAQPKRPRGLVLAPTRELAAQITNELELLAKPKGPWVTAVYGGVGFDRQLKALARGVDIVVACPGRLADLVSQRHIDLRDVDYVVIDEADRMADMGFLPEVRRLLDACAKDRQTLLFSATLDGDVDVLIKRYQRHPARHDHVVEGDDTNTEHLFWSVERAERVAMTARLVDQMGPSIVFCRTKRGTDRVARQLSQSGLAAAPIHGDRSQGQRERALKAFRSGEVKALVATDVAARGIHVDDVACVVHYDMAGDEKAYVHRSGRTARAGASGVVVSLVPAELRKEVAALQRALDFPVGLTSPVAEPSESRHGGSERRERSKPRPSGAARRKAKRLVANEPETVASLSGANTRRSGARAPSRGRKPSRRPGDQRAARKRRR